MCLWNISLVAYYCCSRYNVHKCKHTTIGSAKRVRDRSFVCVRAFGCKFNKIGCWPFCLGNAGAARVISLKQTLLKNYPKKFTQLSGVLLPLYLNLAISLKLSTGVKASITSYALYGMYMIRSVWVSEWMSGKFQWEKRVGKNIWYKTRFTLSKWWIINFGIKSLWHPNHCVATHNGRDELIKNSIFFFFSKIPNSTALTFIYLYTWK